jgi:DNA mismatch repair ATPase MutS
VSPSLDAVEDLMNHLNFEGEFMEVAKGLPDLERIVSRIHAKNCKVKDFLKVLKVTIPVFIVSSAYSPSTVFYKVEQRSIQVGRCF